jgi:hypothetical protein
MESLKKFKNKQIKGNSIFGGKWTDTGSETTHANGCVEKMTDKFWDANGDGVWGQGENGSACISVNCK